MPLMILGLVFAVGLFAYYIFSTSSSREDSPKEEKQKEDPPDPDEDLKKEDNVIFLPSDLEKMKDKHRKK